MIVEPYADNYIVSETELKIMIAGLGYEHVFGLFEENQDEEESRDKILKVIVSMLGEKKLRSDGESIYISDPLKAIVSIVAKANRTALVQFMGERTEFCCYFSSQTAVCEVTDYQPKMFRLSMSDTQSVAKRIVDMDIYPNPDICKETDDSKRLWEQNGIKVLTAQFYSNCVLNSKLEVEFPALGNAQIVISENGSVNKLDFNKETLYKVLIELMSTDENITLE